MALLVAAAGMALAARAFGGGGERKVGEAPSITPKANGVIYFKVGSGDTEPSIHQVQPDGTGERQVFPPDPTDPRRYNEIAWSPDGTRIAYGDNLVDNFGIYAADPDGTDATRLTDGVNDGWPSWSPDGTRIAFSSSRADPNAKPCGSSVDFQCPADLYVMNVDGTGVTRLTEDPAAEYQPAWSPDGTKIAFERAIDAGTGTAIFVMNADGANVKQVSSAQGGSDMYASWSPDGSQIVFSSIRYEDWSISVVNADGTGEHPLLAKGGYVDDPVWSPDGRLIAFIGEDFAGAVDTGDGSALYVMDSNGTDITKIADAPGYGVAGDLAWQPIPAASESPSPVQARVTDVIDLGGPGSAVVYGEGSVWVAVSNNDGTLAGHLLRLDPATGKTVADIPVDAVPTWEVGGGGLAAGDGSVWIAGSADAPGGLKSAGGGMNALLIRIDAATNRVADEIDLGGWSGADVAIDGNGVWVWIFEEQNRMAVVRLDPANDQVVARIPVEASYGHFLFAGGGGVIAVGNDVHAPIVGVTVLFGIDPQTNRVTESLPLGQSAWPTMDESGLLWS